MEINKDDPTRLLNLSRQVQRLRDKIRILVTDTDCRKVAERRIAEKKIQVANLCEEIGRLQENLEKGPELLEEYQRQLQTLLKSEEYVRNRARIFELQELMRQANLIEEELC